MRDSTVAARVGRHYDSSWPGGAKGWMPGRRFDIGDCGPPQPLDRGL